MRNLEFSQKDETFRKCCDLAGVSQTRRQASKFRREKGKAYKIGYPEFRAQVQAEAEAKENLKLKEELNRVVKDKNLHLNEGVKNGNFKQSCISFFRDVLYKSSRADS